MTDICWNDQTQRLARLVFFLVGYAVGRILEGRRWRKAIRGQKPSVDNDWS